MDIRRRLGGVIHTYQKYDPKHFPSPTRPPPDLVSGAMEHMLAYGSLRELTEEELARAVRIDPSQIAGLGPSLDALVVGTSNKTERLLGYGTVYGDLACSFNPIGDLCKTQVRQLARHIGIPEGIIRKTPSAELWEGQTDEAELGFNYEELDEFFCLRFERRLSREELKSRGFQESFMREVEEKVVSSNFKRRLPRVPILSERPVDGDVKFED